MLETVPSKEYGGIWWLRRGNGPREPQVEQRRQELLALLQKHDVTPLQGASTRVFQVRSSGSFETPLIRQDRTKPLHGIG